MIQCTLAALWERTNTVTETRFLYIHTFTSQAQQTDKVFGILRISFKNRKCFQPLWSQRKNIRSIWVQNMVARFLLLADRGGGREPSGRGVRLSNVTSWDDIMRKWRHHTSNVVQDALV